MNVDLTKGIYRRVYAGGIRDGQRINNLSIGAAYWFFQIHAACDDYGNIRATPQLLLADAAPRRANRETSSHPIKVPQVEAWMRELVDAKLLSFYEVAGERFAHIRHFETLQPGGKNGRRVQRFPAHPPNAENPGESRCIQNNPGVTVDSQSGPPAGSGSGPASSQQDHDQDQDQGQDDPAASPLAGPAKRAVAHLAGGWSGKAAAAGTDLDKRGVLVRLGVGDPMLSELIEDARVTLAICQRVGRQRTQRNGHVDRPGAWAVTAIRNEVARENP
jgi:hypothetical protein